MSHILILPEDLRVKLNRAYTDEDTQSKWLAIGVDTVDDMINHIVGDLNLAYPVLSITSIREENKNTIKSRIDSTGNASKFVGYFENDRECVDALFYYIPPDAANANDFFPAKIMPPLFGMYNDIKDGTKDLHIHCMPVFIINLCTTLRVANASVKKQMICCETLGFYYYDIFRNGYHDVIGRTDADGNAITKLYSLSELDELLSVAANNKWFEVDYANKILKILSTTVTNSTNATSDVYRLSLYAIPAVYFAADEGFDIDVSSISTLSGDVAETLRNIILKLKNKWRNIYMQTIYFGAPGTGKSHTIDTDIISGVSDDRVFRVTFYPDFTYNDFIGQLLPKEIPSVTPGGASTITYDFQKGVFTNALEKAYENTANDVYLVVEEMSRGDCATIFGDLFQLLDREKVGANTGYSKYFINNELIAKDIITLRTNGNKVKLPPNFHILGTVNTSDQNVFVMDTAFKRRFEWEYISPKPILGSDPGTYKNNVQLFINDGTIMKSIYWVDLYQKLNIFIADEKYLGLGEDKQLGPFFIEFDLSASAEDHKKQIKNKLLHYLWSDVHKASYRNDMKLFKEGIGTFAELYDAFDADEQVFCVAFIDIL